MSKAEARPPAYINGTQCPPARKITRMARNRMYCSSAKQKPCRRKTTGNETKRCLKPGPKQRNPYLNFLREYRQNHCGLSAVETVRHGAKAWKSLTNEEKAKYIVEAFYTRKGRRRLKSSSASVGRHRLARSRKSKRRERKVRTKG